MDPRRKILFVCTANRLRSPTAERLYRDRPDLEVRSDGLDRAATCPLTRELLGWADLDFVFERQQRTLIQKRFPDLYRSKPIECLYVPDEYDCMAPELVSLLRMRLARYLDEAPGQDAIMEDEGPPPEEPPA